MPKHGELFCSKTTVVLQSCDLEKTVVYIYVHVEGPIAL